MESRKVLVSLTTLRDNPKSNWKNKIEEIKKYNLKEIALFLTGLDKKGREELYLALKDTSVKSLPHVHLRNDMEIHELDYLVDTYNVQAMNLHPLEQYPMIYDYSKYNSIIYLENTEVIPGEKDIEKFGGMCIDFTHWESAKMNNYHTYNNYENKLRKIKVGCSHVSVINDKVDPYSDPKYPDWIGHDHHLLEKLSEVDYLKNYINYLPELISIELENSIEEQLEVKKYIEKNIL
jgi:hypothetical protein